MQKDKLDYQDVIVFFTKKTDILVKGLKEPMLFSKAIWLSGEVKYFGLTLDKGLTWKHQLDKAINKAFWRCRGTLWKTWGLTPKVVRVYWIYTVVVRPIITYAATIWWPRVKLKRSQAELSKLQRTAYLEITHCSNENSSNRCNGNPTWTPYTAFDDGSRGQVRKLQSMLQ